MQHYFQKFFRRITERAKREWIRSRNERSEWSPANSGMGFGMWDIKRSHIPQSGKGCRDITRYACNLNALVFERNEIPEPNEILFRDQRSRNRKWSTAESRAAGQESK